MATEREQTLLRRLISIRIMHTTLDLAIGSRDLHLRLLFYSIGWVGQK